MPYYPKLKQGKATRVMMDAFLGYNHNPKIADGEFYETLNLSNRYFPLLTTRQKHGILNNTFTNLQAIIAKDALYWVDNGTLYANGYATGLTGLQTELETQLVSMGAYICVFPDKKYINTQDLTDYGSMGASWNYTGSITYTMCHADGEYYTNVVKTDTEPEDPDNGEVWIDTVEGNVKEYSAYTQSWIVIETVYTRVDFLSMGQISTAFKEYDGVDISGLYYDDLNGSKILYAVGGDQNTSYDYVVLVGIQEEQYTQTGASVTIARNVPDMDYVCEAQNRLWGCFYGNDGTQNLNEIYCCALGDFKNWSQYLGVSTDSWRGSRGSDGPFTGCINYLGTPTFFKENVIHPVSVSSVGAHQIDDIPARGVQQGSWRSLAVVNETLYYKARAGIMAYQGGMPVDVGAALGEERYYDAVAGVFGQSYYISMKDSNNVWHFFCYDVRKGLWMHENNLHAEMFARVDDSLFVQYQNKLLDINGAQGVLEDDFEWEATSGIMYYEQNVRGKGATPVRYLSHYNIRLNMAHNSTMCIDFEYDSSGIWTHYSDIKLPTTGTATIPVRPRRCDHLRMRLRGKGEMKIYSIARILEQGSDV